VSLALMLLGLAIVVLMWMIRQVVPQRKEWRQAASSITTAIALGRSGRPAEGYERLRSALRAARDLRDSVGEPWAEDLVRALQDALDRYSSRYGSY
jgi:hypothetical protein